MSVCLVIFVKMLWINKRIWSVAVEFQSCNVVGMSDTK